MFRYLMVIIWVAIIAAPAPTAVQANQSLDVLYQTSTINALLAGVYDGDVTFRELKSHGDFGLGTFNALDGEMIALEGRFFQVKTDGVPYPVPDTMKTPFSVVTFFEPDMTAHIDSQIDMEGLEAYLDKKLPTLNLFYAFRIDGAFSRVKARSVPRQSPPYIPLVEVIKQQSVFEFRDVEGTLVGFRCPDFVKGLNVPGYHFHFISNDRKHGGHVLALDMTRGRVAIDESSQFFMALPEKGDFHDKELAGDQKKDLEKIEK